MTTLFVDVTALCMNTEDNADLKAPVAVLQLLLDSLHAILKHVSDVVRKALQVSLPGQHRG